jgi:FkbM family methyltransferase
MLLRIKQWLHRCLHRLGVPAYCKLAYNGLDDKLARFLDFEGGVFLEAGANDGLQQSNTYYLERKKGWRGILVEPIPRLFQQCQNNRPNATCVCAALVPRTYAQSTVQLVDAGLMTMVAASGNPNFSEKHIATGLKNEALPTAQTVEARAMTLDAIIEASGHPRIDFMSLDLEGYEAEALKGLNLEQHGPTWLLLEVRNRAEIEAVIGHAYEVVAELTQNADYADILFKRS